MEVEYRNRITLLILGVIGLVFIFHKGLSLIDYEDFEAINLISLWLGLTWIYNGLKPTPKIILSEDKAKFIETNRTTEVSYDEIKGLSKWMDSTRIILKNGRFYLLNSSYVKNYKDIRKFLFERKGVKKLSFVESFSVYNFISALLFLFMIIAIIFLLSGNRGELKYHLPLRSIHIMEIEGTLAKETNVKIFKRNDEISLITAGINLDEYPDIVFSYPRRTGELRNKTVLYNERENLINENTKVKIQIRVSDYKTLKNTSIEGEKKLIKYYSLKIDDKIMMEKDCLKLKALNTK